MATYTAYVRGYWKVSNSDLEKALSCDVIEFPIDGTGQNWADGPGVLRISRKQSEWEYLFNHYPSLKCFQDHGFYSSGKGIPLKLRNCFIRRR